MLHTLGLPKNLWGEAIKHAVWLKNQISMRALNGKIPYKMLYGIKPNLCDLHKFGCKVWVHLTDRSKLDGHARIGCWLGFDNNISGHRIYWQENWSISVKRSVKFDKKEDTIQPSSMLNEGENKKDNIQQSFSI